MTRLLLSVRDVAEAEIALAAGADLIDLKEPARFACATSAAMMQDVLDRVAGRVPVSAALGELVELDLAEAARVPSALEYAKVGLAGCARHADWAERWQRAIRALPAGVAPVAVVYADHAQVAAPAPAEVVEVGARLGCRAALVDTCGKADGGLLDRWSLAQVGDFIAHARQAGLLAVLGGSLDSSAIERLLPLKPDVVAVRGAACVGGRSGPLDAERAARLAAMLGRAFPAASISRAKAPAAAE